MNEAIIHDLAAPFAPSEIHWRVGSTNKKMFDKGKATERKGLPLAYVNARDVMERLDAVLGAENWSDKYQESQKRLFCSLALRINGEWISKTDGAGDTDMEGQKGGISDAFKRAAVKWGIGRYLYESKAEWITLDEYWRLPKNFNGEKYLAVFSSKQMRTKYWKALKDAAANSDAGAARELSDELNEQQKLDLWNDLSSGVRAELKALISSTHNEEAA